MKEKVFTFSLFYYGGGIMNFKQKRLENFKKTIKIFIKWICKKFDIAEDYTLVRDFEKETRILLDAEKQIQKEDREKEWDLER